MLLKYSQRLGNITLLNYHDCCYFCKMKVVRAILTTSSDRRKIYIDHFGVLSTSSNQTFSNFTGFSENPYSTKQVYLRNNNIDLAWFSIQTENSKSVIFHMSSIFSTIVTTNCRVIQIQHCYCTITPLV